MAEAEDEVRRLLSAGSTISEAERLRAATAVLDDLRRTQDHLSPFIDRLDGSLRPVQVKRKGHTRFAGSLVAEAMRCTEAALKALDPVLEGVPLWLAHLDLARAAARRAAFCAGAAAAVATVNLPGHRPKSRARQFAAILEADPDMPAARVNAKLQQPFDDAQARRLARQTRARMSKLRAQT